jgi:murein DD-endopeptidase MepM/ murein hydrolase activator NlpD
MSRAGQRAGRGVVRGGLLAALAVSGAVAAFGTLPPAADADVQLMLARTSLRETLPLRLEEAALAVESRYFAEDVFRAGDTVAGLLVRLGVAEPEAQQLARMSELRQLRAGSTVRAQTGADGALLGLDFLGPRDTRVRIERAEAGFRASLERAPLETRIAMKTGVIRSSLFEAADAAGVPDGVALQLAEVFGGELDFHRDLRRGDRFSVVYDTLTLEGRAVRAGRLLAAEFVNQGRSHRALWYGSGYYAPDGSSLRKAFLRSPLEFSRVSSGFGMRRHPFLKSWRAHRGVDYAAPIGTRVRAVADGVVEFAGRQGGYGNVVILRHQGQTTTLYGHLNAIARGLRKGSRVRQGEALGTVGQTGWATGPHLHYEFRIAGEARNPLALRLPAAQPVAAHELRAFRQQAGPFVARLDLLANAQLALLE